MPYLRIARVWLPLAIITTALSGLVYVGVQQSYRQSAYDPQVQMAEDAARSLAASATPEAVAGSATVDVAKSLAPFLIVYDHDDEPVAGSGRLTGKMPTPPRGVLARARMIGQNRVTWQPRADVRLAIVVVSVEGADRRLVLAGRSLREVESRVDQLTLTTGAVWISTMLGTLVAIAVIETVVLRRSRALPPGAP